MRKIKVDLQCKVPSWNYCNCDDPTPDQRYSKERCRFCVSTKQGHYCTLYDTPLAADKNWIYKPDKCIKATAGYSVSVEDETAPSVDPKLIMRETLKSYNKMVKDLMSQNYPRSMAETIATKYILED